MNKRIYLIMFVLLVLAVNVSGALNSSDLYAYFNLDNTTGDTTNPSKIGSSVMNFSSATSQFYTTIAKYNSSINLSLNRIADIDMGTNFPAYKNKGTVNLWFYPRNKGSDIGFNWGDAILTKSTVTNNSDYSILDYCDGVSCTLYHIAYENNVGTVEGNDTCVYGSWCMITITGDDTSNIKIYVNGNLQTITVKSGAQSIRFFDVGNKWRLNRAFRSSVGAGSPTLSYVDDIAFFKYPLNASQIVELYNGKTWDFNSSSVSPTRTLEFIAPTPANNTIQYYTNNATRIMTTALGFTDYSNTTINFYNATGGLIAQQFHDQNITDLNITGLTPGKYWFNATAYTTNGTKIITDTRKFILYNITPGAFSSPSAYQEIQSTINIVWSNSTTTENAIAISTFILNVLNDTGSLNRSLGTYTGLNYSWNTYPENLSVGSYILQITTIDANGNQENITQPFNLTANHFLNVTATNINIYNSTVGNFSLNITSLNSSYTGYYSTGTANTSIMLDLIRDHKYSIMIDANGFALQTLNITQTKNITDTYKYFLYTTNSLGLTIYDENTNLLILENISIILSGSTETTYSTTSGALYIDNITDGSYLIKAQGGNYSLRTYSITVANRSTQTLNIFLSANTQNVLFTLLDQDSGSVIEGADMTQYRQINSTWTTIQTKASDITGRTQFSFLPNIKYRFIITDSRYISKTFDLDPIIFTSYNVLLKKASGVNLSMDYTGVNVYYNPQKFYKGLLNEFVWTIQSDGFLTDYFYNLTWSCGSYSFSGSNAHGGYSNYTFNLTCGSWTDRVKLYHEYRNTIGDLRNYTHYFEIVQPNITANTLIKNVGNPFGLGLFDRIVIVTLVVIVVAGAISLVSGSYPLGVFIGLLCYAYFLITGFIPIWSLIITIIMLIMYFIYEVTK